MEESAEPTESARRLAPPTAPEELARGVDSAAYWRDRDMSLDHDHCFLCGVELDDSNRTYEHVFPKWLQRDSDLWQEKLTLLNGTTIRYVALRIPCCSECNGYWLSQIEDQVAAAFRAGPQAVEALDQTTLGLWMAKVYYGIHFKEVALPADRRDPDGATIVSPDDLARFAELHHVLQAARNLVRFTRPLGSVKVFSAQVPDEPRHRFDYRDIGIPFLAVRIGPTVVIASLLDWGAFDAVDWPVFDAAARLDLHPSQFAEVSAAGAYLALKFNREFAYLVTREGDQDVIEPVIVEPKNGPDPARPPFDPMVLDEYARVLAEFTGLEIEDIYDEPSQRLWSNLRNDDDTLAVITLEQAPYGTPVRPPGWFDREREQRSD